ncbi:MAG TPA: hypothetical protein VNF26_07320 [Candidatus Baltobacterales bacterium]|nr:hypothetical protein [Candidatus Baltobacterales bacterium]
MKITAGAGELLQTYEALRAQAVGQLTPVTPRGLALFYRSGMVAWMSACAPLTGTDAPVNSAPSINGAPRDVLTNSSAELVRVLTEMVLGGQRRCYA